MEQVREAVAPLQDEAGLSVHIVGSTALIVALDEVSAHEALRSFPVAVVLSLVVLAWRLRSLAATVAAAISCALTVVLTVVALRLAGGSLTMVTAALPALLFVLALSNAIHILSRFQRARLTAAAPQAMTSALTEAARPCALAALTTALGFVSLLAAGMAPVRELGVLAAAGLVISLVVNLTVTAELALWLRVAGRSSLAVGDRRTVVGLGRPWLILAASLGATALAALLIPRVRLQSDPLSFLPASHPTVGDYAVVGQYLTGFYTLEVVLRTPTGFLDPSSWPLLDGMPESSERERLRADLIAVTIRTNFRAKRSEAELRSAIARALELDQSNPWAWVSAAKPEVFAPSGRGQDLAEALRLLERALALDPDLERARLLRARALEFAGELDGARAELRAVLAANPQCRPASSALVRLDMSLEKIPGSSRDQSSRSPTPLNQL